MNFAIIGLGFISPRHIQAIQNLNGNIVWGCDILPEKEETLYNLCKDKQKNNPVFFTDWREPFTISESVPRFNLDYLVICTPNYLHFPITEFIYRHNLNNKKQIKIILEKPPVIKKEHFSRMLDMERNGLEINNCTQLRYCDELNEWAKKMKEDLYFKEVKLNVLIHRGEKYFNSWRVDMDQCGPLSNSILIHYVDTIINFFGKPNRKIIEDNYTTSRVRLFFNRAEAEVYLSITQPIDKQERSISIKDGIHDYYLDLIKMKFENLHGKMYEDIIKDKGVRCKDIENTMEVLL